LYSLYPEIHTITITTALHKYTNSGRLQYKSKARAHMATPILFLASAQLFFYYSCN